MITGQVVAHHVLVNVPLRIPNQPFLRRIPAHVADDSTIFLSVYSATIVWDGAPRDVEVLATTGRQPLLGTLLLDSYKFTADFEDGGTVTIDPL